MLRTTASIGRLSWSEEPVPPQFSKYCRPTGGLYLPTRSALWRADQNYWPESIPKQQLYEPSSYGDEKTIAQRLTWWRQKLAER